MSADPKNGSPDLMENLYGTGEVMLGRESGLSRIDCSFEGFIWSFSGLVLAGLIDVSALSMLHNIYVSANTVSLGKFAFVFGHLVTALMGYVASLVALYLLCRAPEEQSRFTTAVTVHNWAAPLVSAAFSPLFLLVAYSNQTSPDGGANPLLNLISVVWLGVLIFVGFRLIRISLNVEAGRAAALFAATTFVSLVTVEGLEILFGLQRLS